MSNALRLAIVDPDDSSREALKLMLMNLEMIWLEAEASRYEFFSDVVAQTNPDIGLVAIDSDNEKALELVARLGKESPDCAVLVVSSSNDGNLILQAMRAGAKEFLPQPIRIEDLMAALGRISDRHFAGGDGGKPRGSQVIAVAGVIGGVGTTSIAVNLSCALAKREENTVTLVDLDLCLGDADVILDTIPDYTLADVARDITRLDFSLLKRSLTKHSSGLFLLPRPDRLEDIASISPEDLRRVIGLLKASFSYVVVDLSKSYSPIDMLAMEMADHILLVTQLDLPCLRNIHRLMASFSEMEGMSDKIKIVVNRVGLENGHITLKKAEDNIGREIFWKFPNDYRTMIDVRNNGIPLVDQAPKAPVTQAIVAMADAFSPREPAETAESKQSGIGRFFNTLMPSKGGK